MRFSQANHMYFANIQHTLNTIKDVKPNDPTMIELNWFWVFHLKRSCVFGLDWVSPHMPNKFGERKNSNWKVALLNLGFTKVALSNLGFTQFRNFHARWFFAASILLFCLKHAQLKNVLKSPIYPENPWKVQMFGVFFSKLYSSQYSWALYTLNKIL